MAGEIYIGLMTGTSADSLDCAAVEFSDNELNIIGLKNYDIPSNIKDEISENTRSKKLNETLIKDLDLRLGEFFSDKVEDDEEFVPLDQGESIKEELPQTELDTTPITREATEKSTSSTLEDGTVVLHPTIYKDKETNKDE